MSKSFSLFSLLFIILFLTNSCKKDDSEVNPLPGTWVLSSEVSSNCTDPNDNGTYTCTEFCLEYFFTKTTVTIGVDTYNYTLVNGVIRIEINETIVQVTFSISGSTLTLGNLASNGCSVVTTLEKK